MRALAKNMLETALDEELADHLAYDKHDVVGQTPGTPATEPEAQTVITDAVGPVVIEVSPRQGGLGRV